MMERGTIRGTGIVYVGTGLSSGSFNTTETTGKPGARSRATETDTGFNTPPSINSQSFISKGGKISGMTIPLIMQSYIPPSEWIISLPLYTSTTVSAEVIFGSSN